MNLQWFRVPEKIYCKKACLPVALEELKYILNKKKVLIATSTELQKQENIKLVTNKLNELGIAYAVHDVSAGMTNAVRVFEPDCILAFGSDVEIFLAQKLWTAYEHPELNPEVLVDKPAMLSDMLLQSGLQMGKKAYFIAVPCFAGMCSQVKPFILKSNGNALFFADMAIIDTDLMGSEPDVIRWFVRDALYQAVNACDSAYATDYTDGMAVQAIHLIFEYLPKILENPNHAGALERLASAGTMAGIAFSNACASFSAESENHVRCAELLGMELELLTQKLEAIAKLY